MIKCVVSLTLILIMGICANAEGIYAGAVNTTAHNPYLPVSIKKASPMNHHMQHIVDPVNIHYYYPWTYRHNSSRTRYKCTSKVKGCQS